MRHQRGLALVVTVALASSCSSGGTGPATGALPLKGNDTMSMLMALAVNEPTAPSKLKPEIPPALSDLIMKLLAKDPNQRHPTCLAFLQELKGLPEPVSDRRGL